MGSPTSRTSMTAAIAHERGHLERTHHELCTGLTTLRLNVELLRIALRADVLPRSHAEVRERLEEMEKGFDRLQKLARALRERHASLVG